MKLTSLVLGLLKAARADLSENEAHASLNQAAPEAQKFAEIFQIHATLSSFKGLKTVGMGSTAAGRAPNTDIILPASLQNSKLADTVCRDSALEAADTCPNAATQRYPTYDGSCNNRIDTNRGKSFRPLKRLLKANYGDGFQTVRKSVSGGELPGARDVTNLVESAIAAERTKKASVNHMFTQWGQYIVHDIAHTPVIKAPGGVDLDCNCANPHEECINIPISMDDIQYQMENKTCFGLPRSSPSPDKDCNFNQREQVNQISAVLDANTVYGVSMDLLDDLRDPDSDAGELRVSSTFKGSAHGDMLPQSEEMRSSQKKPFQCPMKLNREKMDCFFAGDKRINENAGLASMHTIFLREHNRVARQLKEVNPHWTSDVIFNETRLIIIAMHQAITYKEYLPLLLGNQMMERYDLDLVPAGYFYGYDASIDSTVSNEFTTAAFRFGHSMIIDQLSLPDADWEEKRPPIVMKDALFNPDAYINSTHSDVDPIMRGLFTDSSQEADLNFPSSMKDFLFAEANKFGKDLFAINIQRGRDHGLRGYNEYREFFGMQRAKDFDELKEIPADVRAKLAVLYDYVDDIDVYVGGLAESHVEGGLVGPLFAHMMAAQFRDLKRGDRFYFENGACETIFTPAQLDELKKVTMASLLCTCTDTQSVQRKPFHPPGRDNPRLACGEIYHLEFSRWRQPYINSNDEFGFRDSGSWTAWFPPVSQPLSLEIDVLQRERPGDLCLNTIASELRYINDEPQVRFMCPAGEIIGSDFPPACLDRGRWTSWFDRANPTGADGSDVELINQLRHERPGELCENPLFMQAQTTDEVPARESGDVFEIFDLERGLVCRGQHQKSGVCHDYRIRYFCPNNSLPDLEAKHRVQQDKIDRGDAAWTPYFTVDEPSEYGDVEYLADMREAMGSGNVCATPLDIQVVAVSGEIDALETGDVFKTMRKDKGFICLNSDQTSGKCKDYKVRYLCPQLNIPEMRQPEGSYYAQEENVAAPTQEEATSNSSVSSNARSKQVNLEGLAQAYGLCKQHGMCCEESTFFEDFVINNS